MSRRFRFTLADLVSRVGFVRHPDNKPPLMCIFCGADVDGWHSTLQNIFGARWRTPGKPVCAPCMKALESQRDNLCAKIDERNWATIVMEPNKAARRGEPAGWIPRYDKREPDSTPTPEANAEPPAPKRWVPDMPEVAP